MSDRELQPCQWRVVTWSSKTTQVFPTRREALEYLQANDTDGDWHIECAAAMRIEAVEQATAARLGVKMGDV